MSSLRRAQQLYGGFHRVQVTRSLAPPTAVAHGHVNAERRPIVIQHQTVAAALPQNVNRCTPMRFS